MSIQRKKVYLDNDSHAKFLTLRIEYEGEIESPEDSLTLIGDAWHEDMKTLGYDPVDAMRNIAGFKNKQ